MKGAEQSQLDCRLAGRTMRITWILPDANWGGGTRVIAIYARKLVERRHHVEVISRPLSSPTLRERALHLLRHGRWLRNPAPGSHLDEVGVRHRVLETPRWQTDADVPDGDVVIATWWETAEVVAALSPSKGAKVYFMQDYGAPGMELERLVPTWRLPLHMITIAQWLVDLVHEHAGPIPIDLVANSVDPREFNAPPRGKQRVPTVGFIYRSAHSKGVDIVFEAFEIARNAYPEIRLVGFGPVEVTEKAPAGFEYRLSPGNQELKEIYASCDVWLFASRQEGFGLPILEAMACRTPVIASPAGAAPGLIAARQGGILVGHEDPTGMARAIEEFCAMSEEEWRRYSDRALLTVSSYSWEEATDRFESALRRAVERQGEPKT